jgi:hypothetical protein
MGNIFEDFLPQAIAVAISPLPIIVVILILLGKRARSNGPAFVLGWILGLAVLGVLVFMLAGAGGVSTTGTSSTLAYGIKLLLGLLFLFLAYYYWHKRPQQGKELQLPSWMATLDTFSTGKSFGFAAIWGSVNPKNLGLTLAAALSIAQDGISGTQSAIALAMFVVLASITVATPVVYYLAAGASAEMTLTNWKNWLITNNSTIMIMLFLVLGVLLIGNGLDGLLG